MDPPLSLPAFPLASGEKRHVLASLELRESGQEGERKGHSNLTIPDSWAFSLSLALG